MNVRTVETDFLVLGSGIAGLAFAIQIADLGRVTVITKKDQAESNTNYAQGGIACVLDPEDSFESHLEDTLKAGAGLCHRDVAEMVVRNGPTVVKNLIDWGTQFTRAQENGQYDLGREGGHSHRRVIHAADLTGREVERALLTALRKKDSVELREHEIAFELLVTRKERGKTCLGARSVNTGNGEVVTYRAGAVLLATGGCGRVYLHTTNPEIATGGGVAMAFRVGAPIANMEFIQFHPTSFYNPGGRTFLISEAVRGEGGVLRLRSGQTFMERYHPMGCLAPRDIVARAIDREMKLTGDPHVYLDCTQLDADFLRRRFPNIDVHCRDHGVDFTQDPIPVVPAAHYACGGVLTGLNGETPIHGLFATGEVSCTGLHGANRLASNSLLEALVFSCRAAAHIRERRRDYEPVPAELESPVPWIRATTDNFEAVRISHCRDEIPRFMWDYVGIVRSTERLQLAKERAVVLRREVEGYVREGYLNLPVVELWSMAEIADLIITSALYRTESRGLHYNIDHPERDDEHWLHDTILQK
jgi:L-aspartate oxidase